MYFPQSSPELLKATLSISNSSSEPKFIILNKSFHCEWYIRNIYVTGIQGMGLSFLINDRSFLLLHFICQLCTKYLMLILRLERWFREICLSYIFLMNFPSKKICCFTFSLNNKFVLVEDERVGKTLNMYFDFFHMLGTICDIFW